MGERPNHKAELTWKKVSLLLAPMGPSSTNRKHASVNKQKQKYNAQLRLDQHTLIKKEPKLVYTLHNNDDDDDDDDDDAEFDANDNSRDNDDDTEGNISY